MDIHLHPYEISAIRELLTADPDPHTLLDDPTLLTLMQLVPCDAVGTGEGDPDGSCLRGTELPHRVHDHRGPQQCEGAWITGVVQLAALPAYDPVALFLHRLGVRDNIWVGFPTDAGTVVQVYLERRHSIFEPRDLVLLAMLEPALGRLLRSPPRVDPTPLLTPTERRVLELVSTGASNREVAAELFVSVSTVRKHLENIYRKLGVSNRTSALAAIS